MHKGGLLPAKPDERRVLLQRGYVEAPEGVETLNRGPEVKS